MKKGKEPAGDSFDPNKPLFATRANPRDYSDWLKEYDQMEGDLLGKHDEGHTVSNLKSLRQFCQTRNGFSPDRTAPPTASSPLGRRGAPRQPVRPATAAPSTVARSPPRGVRSLSPERVRSPMTKAKGHGYSPGRWGEEGAAAAAGSAGVSLRRPKSSQAARSHAASPGSPRAAPAGDAPLTYNTMAACLRLVHPPPPSSGDSRKFDVDVRGIDISWVKGGTGAPSAATLTLHSVPDQLLNERGELPERAYVTSPRSAFVLVSNGVSVYDLQAQPLSAFTSATVQGEQARQLQVMHHEKRRVVREKLLEKYEALAALVSIEQIMEMMRSGQDQMSVEKMKNEDEAYLARKEQAKRFLTACRIRMEREQETATTRRQDELRAEQERIRRCKALEEEKARKARAMRQKASEAEAAKNARRVALNEKKEAELQATLDRAKRMEGRDKVQQEKRKAKEEQQRVKRLEAERKHHEMFLKGKERFETLREDMRARYVEKERQAETKRQLREEIERKERLVQRDQALTVAKKREEAALTAKELMQMRVDQSLQKRRDAEERFFQRQEQQQRERQQRRDRERELERERQRKKHQAVVIEHERANDFMSKQRDRDQKFMDGRTLHERELQRQHGIQASEIEEKRFRVRCQARATEFQKAVTLNSISTKMSRADVKLKVKDELVKESTVAREELRRQKEQILADCQRQAAKEKLAM
eukprot:TRINITY_DN6226_c0_g1_i2.p1 TRINITY_DN6226_c0_g1~~TRINITY_DN6226_c0_g1_i2.p1  ORF type:complete len:706 (+),score=271.34 TRINITY_DN6226_c0_g1_i2:137-2254(+)